MTSMSTYIMLCINVFAPKNSTLQLFDGLSRRDPAFSYTNFLLNTQNTQSKHPRVKFQELAHETRLLR